MGIIYFIIGVGFFFWVLILDLRKIRILVFLIGNLIVCVCGCKLFWLLNVLVERINYYKFLIKYVLCKMLGNNNGINCFLIFLFLKVLNMFRIYERYRFFFRIVILWGDKWGRKIFFI